MAYNPLPCWNCHTPSDAVGEPRCTSCRVLQPLPPGTGYFETLGLPQTFSVRPADLDAAFRKASLQVHPDRFARASDRERRLAAERTAAVNEAARVLKDPVKRAVWLLERNGVDVDHRKVDQALLVELMEAREQADEDAQARAALLERTRHESAQRMAELEAGFADVQARGMPPGDPALPALADLVVRVRYLARLEEDLAGTRRDAPLATRTIL